MTNEPGRAQLRGDLVLVGPAAVVGHGRPAEDVVEGWVIDQEEQDLAAHVGVPEVVPVVLRRPRAVADEDELGVRHLDLVDDVLRRGDVVYGRLERPALAPRRHHQVVARQRRDADQRHVLHPRPVRVARRQAERGELLRQKGDRLRLAVRTRRAPLELVRGERLGRGEQRVGADARRDPRRRPAGPRVVRQPAAARDGCRQRSHQ